MPEENTLNFEEEETTVDGEPEGAEPEASELDDFDDETKQIFEREAEKRVAAAQAEWRTSLQGAGLDLTDSGPVIKNADQARQSLGFAAPAAAPAAAPTQEPTAEPAPQASKLSDEPPDFYSDPTGYQQWIVAKATEEARKGIDAEIATLKADRDQLAGLVLQREVSDTTGRVREMLPDLGMGWMLDNPTFDETFEAAAKHLGPGTHGDPDALLTVAGSIVRQMRQTMPTDVQSRQQQPPQDERSLDAARAAANRQSLAATGPSRETTRPRVDENFTDLDKEAAERCGMTATRSRALGQKDEKGRTMSYKDWERMNADEEKRRTRVGAGGRR